MPLSCVQNPQVDRSYISRTSWDLRYRIGVESAYPHNSIHNSSHTGTFHEYFWQRCNSWMNEVNFYAYNYAGKSIDWIGTYGVGVCSASGPWHPAGRAFDLTRIEFSPGPYFMDGNTTWRSERTLMSKRLYLGIVASARRWMTTVITGWATYDTAHDNHIHVDDGLSNNVAGPISTGRGVDTVIVQAACNFLNYENLVMDGAWGPATSSAYQRLLSALRMTCYNPLTSWPDTQLFLNYIAVNAFANQPATWFRGNCP